MASPASRKRNTARMDGNAAYDLRSNAAEEYLYSAPVELPHAPRTTEAVVPESVPTPKQAIAPLAVLGFAIAAVLIVISLVARVQLSQASAEVSALEDQYAELQEQQTRLRIDYESAFNLTEIEDYAIHEQRRRGHGGGPRPERGRAAESGRPSRRFLLIYFGIFSMSQPV